MGNSQISQLRKAAGPSADDHLRHLDAIVQNCNGIPNPNLNPNHNPNHNPNPNAHLDPNLNPDAQSLVQFQSRAIRLVRNLPLYQA